MKLILLEVPSLWESDVWSFSTPAYILVDGFETGYDDSDANAVWATWTGWEDLTNGGAMGNPGTPYLSTTNHSGGHSSPMFYNNGKAGVVKSEVIAKTADLPIGTTNWTLGNPDTLVIWFRGDPNNPVTDKMYVKLNSTKINYGGAVEDIKRTAWTKWEVPLTGINLGNISSIAIGLEKIGSTGGSGVLYLDDIQLTISVPASDPGTANLIAKYNMENNVQDSSGSGLNGTTFGTVNGGPSYQAGKHGMALVLDGNDDYVSLPIGPKINTLTNCTISVWVNWAGGNAWQRIFDFGTGTTNYMFMTPSNGTTKRAVIQAAGGGEDIASASQAIATNSWDHMAVVIDADNSILKLYYNGDLVATDTTLRYAPKNLGATTQNWLGRSQYTTDPYFKGMLDDFRIYDAALSDSEVKYLYKN